MSDANSTIATINLVFKLAELGAKYLENRQQRRIDLSKPENVVDTVEEALRAFEALDIPEPFEPPADQPSFTPHELEEGEDMIANGQGEEVEGEPV